MAHRLLPLVALLLLTLHLGSASNLVVYWGQNGYESGLSVACQSGLYDIVILSFLSQFGNNQEPQLNLAGHCDPASGGCTGCTSSIEICQSLGIKVLLSIGGGAGSYDLVSTEDAQSVATYIWNNYLGGESDSRPLGSAVLDGVDFDIEAGSGTSYYGTLAQTIYELSGGQALLTAAPQCPFPDYHLGPDSAGSALDTGLFSYVWVQFYNNYCQYSSGDASQLLAAWNQWTSRLPEAQVLLGLPASTDAATSGFIPAATLISDVLPQINQTSNYGGVMLWSYYYDEISGYGASIKSSLSSSTQIQVM